MGCYNWFARPLSEDEISKLREACRTDVKRHYDEDGYDSTMLKLIAESAKSNNFFKDPALPNKKWYWFQFGYGEKFIKPIKRYPDILSDEDFGGIFIKSVLEPGVKKANKYKLYASIKLSIPSRLRSTYPKKIIHNKHQLRRFLRKDYFKLTDKDHELLSLFWKTFPKGIMYWG